ncbi:hypothetical protein [Crassaminicella indica]|uniref:Copper amine oxidase N-terminal domain-containing protein n=1 Tax=Crassaminicella indica TaxID=2855394 RepID=A0ABX8RHR9_9CLOT|nr:hypothetical protein [Crassaminicella indica]QXM06486.1 hypothetical protein KVH43_01550 [Crassaminicella indica]
MKSLLKKSLVVLCIFMFTASVSFTTKSFEIIKAYLNDTNVVVNQKSENLKTIYYEGNLYIPIPLLSEKLNCFSSYNKENNTLTLKNNFDFQDFPQSNPYKGENFIYGEILKIDKANKIITIEQHFDDNSISIEPNIKASENIIIIYQRNDKKMNLDFDDLKVGDIVGIVLNRENIARGMILAD